MHFTVLYFCVWVTISLNFDVISLSGTGPAKHNQISIQWSICTQAVISSFVACLSSVYRALPISPGHFSPNNSRKTTMALPQRWDKGIFQELEVWPKFFRGIYCIVDKPCYIIPRHIKKNIPYVTYAQWNPQPLKLLVCYMSLQLILPPCMNYWCRSINKKYIRPVLVVEGTLGT